MKLPARPRLVMPQSRGKGKLRPGGVNVRFRPLVNVSPPQNYFRQPLATGIESSDWKLAISG